MDNEFMTFDPEIKISVLKNDERPYKYGAYVDVEQDDLVINMNGKEYWLGLDLEIKQFILDLACKATKNVLYELEEMKVESLLN